MVDLWSKCPIQKLWQILKSISMKSFIFSKVPKYFSYFYSLLLIFQFGKGIKYWKKNHGPFSSARWPVSTALPAQPISPNRPVPFSSPESLPSGPGASQTPCVSLTPRGRIPLRNRPNTVPITLPNQSPSSTPASCC
jgi:hypothetical protein